MANYPGAIDSAASLYSPVDAFSGKPLETTTASPVLAGDSTINVVSTSGGFAATYGILSIDDELIVYTGKTGTSFTGCLALSNVIKKWETVQHWKQAMARFALLWEDRILAATQR